MSWALPLRARLMRSLYASSKSPFFEGIQFMVNVSIFPKFPKSEGPGIGAKFPDRYRDGKLLCDDWSIQKGAPCRAFAMRGRKQCLHHGGRSPKGFRSPSFKYGLHSSDEGVAAYWAKIIRRIREIILQQGLTRAAESSDGPLTQEEKEQVCKSVPTDFRELLRLYGVDPQTLIELQKARDWRIHAPTIMELFEEIELASFLDEEILSATFHSQG